MKEKPECCFLLLYKLYDNSIVLSRKKAKYQAQESRPLHLSRKKHKKIEDSKLKIKD